ncbi:MAG: amidase [Betaproteobacteria bacterium]|nr:MAG: amidase [Betaproteobacteria bacterium]
MNLADLSAAELAAGFKVGTLSPVDALHAVFSRLDALNPKLNAICFEDRERSRSDARASELRWRAGSPLSALDGVPISIKDLILTQGWPTLRGSRTIDRNQAWSDDAPSVARLREAGLVIFGKTTTPEFGIKGTTDNTLTGITRNPWNLSKTPGGSSGGSAAAVAAGIGPLSIGTDGAGSVRIPAAFTGTFGLKPSFGRVPAWPLSPFGTVAHLGPHTRTVTDAAMLMNVIAKPDPRDWTSLPYDAHDYTSTLQAGVKGLRIAFSPALGYVKNVHPEVAAATRAAAQALAQLGAEVDEIDPGFDDPIEITNKLWFIGSATLYNAMTDAQKALVDPALVWQAGEGNRITVPELQALTKRRGELGTLMRKFHTQYDLLVTPGVSVPAFEAKASGEWELTTEKFLGWTPFSYPFNLTQQPACVCPSGFSSDGLPLSMQIVGPMHGDALVLRAARAFETAQPWKLIAPEA